jgi:hypothetical protein
MTRRYTLKPGSVADRALRCLALAPDVPMLSGELAIAAAASFTQALHSLLETVGRHGLVTCSYVRSHRCRRAAEWRITAAGLAAIVADTELAADTGDEPLGPPIADGYGHRPPGEDLARAWSGAR